MALPRRVPARVPRPTRRERSLELLSAQQALATPATGAGAEVDHATLIHLDYASSGHTGFAATSDLHDPLTIREIDGAPTGQPSVLKITNGTLTDNGDGSFTLTIPAGAVGADPTQKITGGTAVAGSAATFMRSDAAPGIADHAITNALFRQGAGRSVVGVTGGSDADVADIAAVGLGDILRTDETAGLVFGPLASALATLGADVTLTVAATWYDGPTITLAAGIWLVLAHAVVSSPANTAIRSRISVDDGNLVQYIGAEASCPAMGSGIVGYVNLACSKVITLADSTIFTLRARSTGPGAILKYTAENVIYTTQIMAVRIGGYVAAE